MIQTALTRLLGARAPIQLAAMPGIATPALVAAVAEAGGLGMVPTPLLTKEALEAVLDDVASRTTGAWGVNFLAPFLDPACLDVAARRARLVEIFYGDPDPTLVARAAAHGAKVSWQVGSLEEALAAEAAGCDLVVVQGTEAGGHVRGGTSLLPLLAGAVDALRVPVIAAGGVATGRELAAVLACGAAGARLGTRFVASRESGAHPAYVQALLAASAADTCLTEAFSGMWPHAPHRVLRSAVEAAESAREEVLGELWLGPGATLPVPRLSVLSPTTGTTGRVEAMALYAGESVTNVRQVRPAAEIVAELVAGAERALAAAAGSGSAGDGEV